MKIFIGADHGGFALKNSLIPWLQKAGYDIEDCGATFMDPGDDYPEIAFRLQVRKACSPPPHAPLQHPLRSLGDPDRPPGLYTRQGSTKLQG